MAVNHQTILPNPGGRGASLQPPQYPSLSKPKRVTVDVACLPCKKRKGRCSGERPTCQACQGKGINCEYDRDLGAVRQSQIKKHNQQLKSDLGSLMELYWYLQSMPSTDAERALEVIRSGSSPSRALDILKASEASEATDASARPSSRSTTASSAADGVKQFETQEMEFNEEPSDKEELLAMLQTPEALPALKDGADAFFLCTGCIFHVFDRSELEAILAVVLPALEAAGGDWGRLIFGDLRVRQINAALCAACIVAAIGLQYTRDAIPAMDFKTSRSQGTYPFVNIFYRVAMALLEDATESNSLEAMKVCACLGMFNIVTHSTVALAYTDMGISFAANHGLNRLLRPDDVDETQWVNYKRVARTLTTLRSWLIATLGYVPATSRFNFEVHWMVEQEEASQKEIIQQEMAKVTVLKFGLVRRIDSSGDVSPEMLSSIRQAFAQWHEQLPSWMHLWSLLGQHAVSNDLKRIIYLVHLFYLSANIFVTRIALGKNLSMTNSLPASKEMRDAVGDGLVAARTGARILDLQLREGSLFRQCWLCEFTAYMSALILLSSATHMLLLDGPQHLWLSELCHAKMCISLLKFCGHVDMVAKQFYDTTQVIYEELKNAGQVDEETIARYVESTQHGSNQDADHFFGALSGSTTLHSMSRRLQELISHPFSKLSFPQADKKSSGKESSSPRLPLDWKTILLSPLNQMETDPDDGMASVSKAMSDICAGHFAGSSTPQGWHSVTPYLY